jgi:hypothetical protein
MSLRSQFMTRLRERVADARLPLRVTFWDGEVVDFAGQPWVTIKLLMPRLMRFFLTGDSARLGRAYVEGEIDVVGACRTSCRSVSRLLSGSANSPGCASWLGCWAGAVGMLRPTMPQRSAIITAFPTTSIASGLTATSPGGEFIDRLIFPGGEVPHSSRVLYEGAGTGLELSTSRICARITRPTLLH